MRIAVIDGMGGGLAAQVVSQLTGKLPEQVELIGLGTNALATAAMLKAGVKRIAEAVGSAAAKKVLLPVSQNHFEIVGVEPKSLASLVKEAVSRILTLVEA